MYLFPFFFLPIIFLTSVHSQGLRGLYLCIYFEFSKSYCLAEACRKFVGGFHADSDKYTGSQGQFSCCWRFPRRAYLQGQFFKFISHWYIDSCVLWSIICPKQKDKASRMLFLKLILYIFLKRTFDVFWNDDLPPCI